MKYIFTKFFVSHYCLDFFLLLKIYVSNAYNVIMKIEYYFEIELINLIV